MSWTINIDTEKQLKLQYGPTVVRGVEASDILEERASFRLRHPVYEFWIFRGLDRGDVCEMTASIYSDGMPVYLTSIHKENSVDSWEAWTHHQHFIAPGKVNIHVGANTTGRNEYHQRGKDPTSRPHWGLWFPYSAFERE